MKLQFFDVEKRVLIHYLATYHKIDEQTQYIPSLNATLARNVDCDSSSPRPVCSKNMAFKTFIT